MTTSETHVFIVRLWTERREVEAAFPLWRGMIEYVWNGDRRYFQDLQEIVTFITKYLEHDATIEVHPPGGSEPPGG